MTTRMRVWTAIHTWSSLACTLFLLMLCLTGLPLIFSDELTHWLDDARPYAQVASDAPKADLDRIVTVSRHMYPGEFIDYVFMDADDPQVLVGMTPDRDGGPYVKHKIRFDAHTGELLKDFKPALLGGAGVMDIVLKLHTDLFAGLAGELFLGCMGFLFVVALVSGVALYGPFTKRIAFGTVRTDRSRRVKWLDLHNLVGITTLAWALVVGATGFINELSTPLFKYWQDQTVTTMLAPYRAQAQPVLDDLASLETVVETVRSRLPDMTVVSAAFPGNSLGSPYHYMIWTQGNTFFTSRLFSPVLVDSRTGAITSVMSMPWYLRALEVSRPLHFGDYGGLPLKILWAVFDVATLVVLASGLYLWGARRWKRKQVKSVAPA